MCGWCHSELNKQCDILVRLGMSFSARGSIAVQYSEFKNKGILFFFFFLSFFFLFFFFFFFFCKVKV